MPDNLILKLHTVFIAFLLAVNITAQVPVEVSKQKIVSEGKVYYMHKVLKGQTLYSISRAYNVSIDIITGENVIPPNGIQDGQILKIPAASSPAEATGETQARPQPHSRPQVTGDENYFYHKVIKGETLSSLSRQYGIAVRELKKANKGLLFPREGEYLMIPKKGTSEKNRMIEQVLPETRKQEEEQHDSLRIMAHKDSIHPMGEMRTISRLRGSVRVAVMLPFYINENNLRSYLDSSRVDAKGKKIYKEVSLPGGWLYENSIPFIEMYEGMLVAVDSLRLLGLEVDMTVFDTGADTLKVDWLISSGTLHDFDLIIGPVFSRNLGRVAAYAAENNIPVVSPVPLRDRNILNNRPTLFKICPSLGVSQDIMIEEIKKNPKSNIIFLYSDSLMIDPDTESFWTQLTTQLRSGEMTDSSLITPYYFSGLIPKNNTYKGVMNFETFLRPDMQNMIILATSSTPVVSTALSSLHTLSRKYNIKVLGYPELETLTTIDLRYYYDLEMLIPSENYIDFEKPGTKAFMRSYFRKFNTEPTGTSFAWRGFDIAFYFIGGIAAEGRSLLRHPERFNPELLSYYFDFRRDSDDSGNENKGMFVLHYNKDLTVTVRKPWQVSE